LRWLAPVAALALVAAACGDDSGGESGTTAGGSATTAAATTSGGAATTAASTTSGGTSATTAAGTSATTAGGTETTAGGTETTAGGTETTTGGGTGDPCTPDPSIDADEGKNAGRIVAMIQCAETKPLKAEGDPIVIGVQNPEGDPAGSFPEYTLTIQAAADYINNELGGIGGDVTTGKVGRPIQLEVCKMAIKVEDSQRCANELAGKQPFTVISTLNFFGNHFPIYAQAGVSVVVGTPITVGDFTDTSTFSIGAGGGCLGVHTGLVWAATQPAPFLGKKNVAVPWADTPPGVVCYYDLEQKPLQVLKGEVQSSSQLSGSIPELSYIKDGVPIKPATPDVTPQVTQVLAANPEVILYSAQGADCWNLVDGLGRAGWTPDKIPLILSTACLDFEKMRAAGDLAKGVYFVGAAGASLSNPDAITNPRLKLESTTYRAKTAKYGVSDADVTKGFASAGFSVMMNVWEQASLAADLTPDAFKAQFRATKDNHIFGSVPFGCADAVEPYVAVCSTKVAFQQWDGTQINVIVPNYSGVDLIAGTELTPGPS
jgi:branched-chain amino acid transport system substrate-binding protein